MPNITKITKRRLGEILINEGLLTTEQVQEALVEQQKTGGFLVDNLIKLGFITEMDIASALASQFGLPYIDATRYNISKEVFDLLPLEFMEQNNLIVLDKIGTIVTVAITSTLNEKIFAEIEKRTACQVFIFVSTRSQIRQATELLKGSGTKR
jgi:type IV pilus assembly protein PilB